MLITSCDNEKIKKALTPKIDLNLLEEDSEQISFFDNEINKKLKKSLDSISKEKINPDYEFQNTQQQAGFAAEVKDTARTNAENIIASKKERKVRTDDIDRVNDELYDHMLSLIHI